jgi:hypothetical protein
VLAWLFESVAVIVKVKLPAAIGVPETAPLGESASPAGSEFGEAVNV